MRNKSVRAPLLSDRQLNTLYVILGLQAAVMLVQLILGLVARLPIKELLLFVFVYDLISPIPYGVHVLVFIDIRQTLKAKKQLEETGGEPVPAMTRGEAFKTPRMRSWLGMCIIFAVLGVIIGVIAMRLPDDRVRVTFVLIALGALFLLTAIAVLVQWRIFRKGSGTKKP